MMKRPDPFCTQYSEYLDGTYDCVDRIVLNAYYILGQSPGGFRTFWRKLTGGDETLDNAHLMKLAGRFSRRIHAWAKEHNIPLIHCERGERKHQVAEPLIPKDPTFKGIFCVLVGRAPSPVYEIQTSKAGALNIRRKQPNPWVNQYSFHIMDPEWGHIIIKLCPHPPFNAQIILNGHEYVARQAEKKQIPFDKEGNCFTHVPEPTALSDIADTMKAPGFVGRIQALCDRWIYSACLCFALNTDDQEKTNFSYSYSVYQVEYSRNLLFTRGTILDRVFESLIDRNRSALSIKTVKTIFGYKHRPHHRKKKSNRQPIEVVVETPAYNLTVFKVHFGKLTVKLYSKGERVLRVEAVAHNVTELRCGRVVAKFPTMVQTLTEIVERFLGVLRSVDVSLLDLERIDAWPRPSQVGAVKVGGVDANSVRIRSVMQAVIALALNPRGFTSGELSETVQLIMATSTYHARQAAYDLKKLRGKELVERIGNSHYYQATPEGLRVMMAFLTLRNKVIVPLLASTYNKPDKIKFTPLHDIGVHYQNIQKEMADIFNILKLAA
ncbi:MAG: hypothetical protein AABZ06_05910 [Bdellovibrionota bacterium]